jgi:hypothetical protein
MYQFGISSCKLVIMFANMYMICYLTILNQPFITHQSPLHTNNHQDVLRLYIQARYHHQCESIVEPQHRRRDNPCSHRLPRSNIDNECVGSELCTRYDEPRSRSQVDDAYESAAMWTLG